MIGYCQSSIRSLALPIGHDHLFALNNGQSSMKAGGISAARYVHVAENHR